MPTQLHPTQLDQAFAVMRDGIACGESHDVVMAVATSEKLVRCETAAPAGHPPPPEDAIFLLASITKPVIATAILQLAEAGRLLLSDPVVRHIPEFGCYGKSQVTIWHLLTHTSGMAEGVWNPLWARKAPASEFVQVACETFLRFLPGTAYQYCNLSFWILAEIIARISGTSYVNYMQTHILNPLGMQDTGFDFADERVQRMMPVNIAKPDNLMATAADADYFVSLALPAGGLWSTAADLVAFGQAILNGWSGRKRTIVSHAGIRHMTDLQTTGLIDASTNKPAFYGLGWGKPNHYGRTLGTSAAFGHGGATSTLLWIEPDYDLVFVFLTNLWGQEHRTANLALNAVLGTL